MTPVVLVEGDDPILVSEAVARVVGEQLEDRDRALALEDYSGDDLDLAAVADGCATPPLLVDRRVVVVREVGSFGAEGLAPLLAYLDDPLATTSLVLASGGGKTPAKLLAAVKSKGQLVSTIVDSRAAPQWVRDRLRSAPVSLDASAASMVGEHFGEDVSRLVPLIDLLTTVYGAGAKLMASDVEPYLGEAGSVTPWAFTDAIDSGQTETALQMMRRLLEGGDRHPLVVLAVLARHVQSLLRVDDPGIRTEADAARAMGIGSGRSTYPAKKALATSQRMGSANVADAVCLVADAELDLKGRSAWSADSVLEVLVARLCRLAGSRPRR